MEDEQKTASLGMADSSSAAQVSSSSTTKEQDSTEFMFVDEQEDEASDSMTFAFYQTKYLSANVAQPIWRLIQMN